MPMTFHYYDTVYSPTSDVARLDEFLQDTKLFLWRLTRHSSAFIHELYNDVSNAWDNAQESFEDARDRLNKVAQETLEEHGLTGDQLRLKLRNVEKYFGDLISGMGSTALEKLLNVVNNLLDSIIQALGIPGVIKEIKDAIKSALA